MKICSWFKKKYCHFFNPKPIVNVLNLEGIIGSVNFKQGLTLAALNEKIEKSFTGENIKAVVLAINSPGGSPVQSELIAKRIQQLSQQKNIPIITFVEDIAASGGYWLACAAPEIIVAENAILGSLGVKFSGFGFNKSIEKLGIERRVHTKGDSKAFLDPFLPEKQEDIDVILSVQTDIYNNFKNHVHKNRPGKLKIEDEELFSGSIWSSKQAIEIGLVDKIGDLYSEMQERFGTEVEIRLLNQEKSWLKRKLGISLDLLSQLSEIFQDKKFELR